MFPERSAVCSDLIRWCMALSYEYKLKYSKPLLTKVHKEMQQAMGHLTLQRASNQLEFERYTRIFVYFFCLPASVGGFIIGVLAGNYLLLMLAIFIFLAGLLVFAHTNDRLQGKVGPIWNFLIGRQVEQHKTELRRKGDLKVGKELDYKLSYNLNLTLKAPGREIEFDIAGLKFTHGEHVGVLTGTSQGEIKHSLLVFSNYLQLQGVLAVLMAAGASVTKLDGAA